MTAMENSFSQGIRFHHISIKCADFDRSFEFYTKTLGMNAALQWGEGDKRGCMMDIGGGSYVEIFAGGAKSEPQANPPLHFCLLVDECDKFYNRALDAGLKGSIAPKDVVIPAREGDLPVRIAFIYGPDNEYIEFFQYR